MVGKREADRRDPRPGCSGHDEAEPLTKPRYPAGTCIAQWTPFVRGHLPATPLPPLIVVVKNHKTNNFRIFTVYVEIDKHTCIGHAN